MRVKFIFPVIAVIAMFMLTTCEDILDVKFTYSTSDMTFEYGPDTITGNLVFMHDSIVSKLDSIALKNGSNLTKLKSAKLKNCIISISDPSDSNFNMVSSFEAYIGTPTLPQILLANISPVPHDTNSVSLNVNGQELESYLKSPAFNFLIKGTKTKPVGKKYKMKVHLDFDVVADPI